MSPSDTTSDGGGSTSRMSYLAGVAAEDMPAKKRTKTRRACLYCRRSHMTCEDTRPCTRCCKRQIAHLCVSDADAEDKALAERPTKVQRTKRASPPGEGAGLLPTGGGGGGGAGVDQTPILMPSTDFNPIPSMTTSTILTGVQDPLLSAAPSTSSSSSHSQWLGLSPPPSLPLPQNGSPNQSSSSNPTSTSNINNNGNHNGNSNGPLSLIVAPSPTNSATPSLSNFWTDWDWLETSLAAGGGGGGSGGGGGKDGTTSRGDPFSFLMSGTGGAFSENSPEGDGEKEGGSPLMDVVRLRSQVLSLPHAEEDEPVQPNNYTFGYSRLKRWSSERSIQIHDAIEKATCIFRPVLHKRLAACSDEELIASEIAFRTYVKAQQQALQVLPVAACVWRRTGELYVANKRMINLTQTGARMWQAGKLCLYDIIDPPSFINYWQTYSANVLPHIEQNGEGWEIDFKGGVRRVGSNELTRCQISCSVIMDENSFPLAVLGIFVPITQ